jgi:hypothetical protein|tara:strand:- start:1062 stop:1634 length:573 start_codon:yes stop_codon:yes gene_type:complete
MNNFKIINILLLLFFVLTGCNDSRHIQSYRMPKKDFGLANEIEKGSKQNNNVSGLSWSLPETWAPSDGHSMRLASFNVPYSKGVGDLSIVSLSGESGGLVANVNRWRRQIDLDPIDEQEILASAVNGESRIGPFRLFRLVNDANKEKAILAAVLPIGSKTFFIKLTASQQGISELRFSFMEFCSSIGEAK